MADDRAVTRDMRGQVRGGAADRAIAELARRQHDVMARRQLIELGIGPDALDRRLASSHLRRIHRGVYTVRQASLGREAAWMAAVLLGGEGAVLSHRSAGALWGVRQWTGKPEVTLPHRRRQCKAVRFHYGATAPDELTTRAGIPVTGVSRTLLDLAAVLPKAQLEAALAEADVRRLTDSVPLTTLLSRYPRRAGVAVLRALLAVGAARTRSDLEIAFLELLAAAGLPRPATNVWLRIGDRWIEADCVWWDQRLLAELGGRAAHDTAARFEADRARDRLAAAHGWRTVRITWRHLSDPSLIPDLRRLLAAPAGPAPALPDAELRSRTALAS